MTQISERNRKVAINRWKKQIDKSLKDIDNSSAIYPELKARIIGYIMGDGSATIRKEKTYNHHTICFYPDDTRMLEAFLDAFKKLYGFTPNVKKLQNHYQVRADSKAILTDLFKYGSFRSLEWCIPKKLLTSKLSKQEWLRAFYDCEGYVGPRVIAIQSVNKHGLQEIQNLLKEFEIKSQLYSYKRKQQTWNTNYLLYITRREERYKFLKNIGFNHFEKQKKLEKFAAIA